MTMQTYARIAAGTVAELIVIDPEGPPLAERFHADIVAAMVPVPDGAGVAEGWQWDGAAFSPPPAPPPPTADEVRARRNTLLTACDWTQMPDSPLGEWVRLEWATYRTALRNVPSQPGFPADVTWPTPPG
jgi:hypothetical protein